MGVASGKIFSGALHPFKHPLLWNPGYATACVPVKFYIQAGIMQEMIHFSGIN